MSQEFKPLSVGNNVTVIPCVEPVKKIVWIFVMIFSKCLLNRYFIFSLNPPAIFLMSHFGIFLFPADFDEVVE